MEQNNKSPEVDSYIYCKLVFDKSAKIIQWGKGKSVQQLVLEEFDKLLNGIKILTHVTHTNNLRWIIGLT